MSLSRVARAFGECRLDELAQQTGLTPEQCLIVLSRIDLFRDFYSWVEADHFILYRMHNEP
jgi:hypothetical protein